MVVAGCGSTSQERIDGLSAFLGVAQEQSAMVDDHIVTLRTTLADLQATANDPALSPASAIKINAALAATVDKLTVAVDIKAQVDKAITDALAKIEQVKIEGDGNIGDEIKVTAAAIRAASTGAPPPYNAYGGILAAIVAFVGTVVAKYLRNQRNDERKLLANQTESTREARRGRNNAEQKSYENYADLVTVVNNVEIAKGRLPEASLPEFKVTLAKGVPSRTADKIMAIKKNGG